MLGQLGRTFSGCNGQVIGDEICCARIATSCAKTRSAGGARRLEFRCPDPGCNGYPAWSAMPMAMIDGIRNRVDRGDRWTVMSTS